MNDKLDKLDNLSWGKFPVFAILDKQPINYNKQRRTKNKMKTARWVKKIAKQSRKKNR